eukprot:Opistho-2@55665
MADSGSPPDSRSSFLGMFRGKKDRLSRSKSDDKMAGKKLSDASESEDALSKSAKRTSVNEAIGIDLCDGQGTHTAIRDTSKGIYEIIPDFINCSIYIPAANKNVQLRLSSRSMVPEAIASGLEAVGLSVESLQGEQGLFISKDDTLRYLSDRRTLLSYKVPDMSKLVIKLKVSEDRSVRVVLPREEIVSQMNYDQYTSVGEALVAILGQCNVSGVNYGMYHPREDIWLEDGELLSAYGLNSGDTIECREKRQAEQGTSRIVLAIHIPSMNVTLKMSAQYTMTVTEVITTLLRKELLKKAPIRDASQYGLVLLPNHTGGKRNRPIWMEDYKFLASFNMGMEEKLEYRSKFEPFHVDIFPRSLGSLWHKSSKHKVCQIDADDRATMRDILEMSCASLSLPDVFDYGVHGHDDGEIPMTVPDTLQNGEESNSGTSGQGSAVPPVIGTLTRQQTTLSTFSGISSFSSATGAIAASVLAAGGGADCEKDGKHVKMRENRVWDVYNKHKDTFVVKSIKRRVQVAVNDVVSAKRKDKDKEIDIDDLTTFFIDFFEPFAALVELVRRRYGFHPDRTPKVFFIEGEDAFGEEVVPLKSPVELGKTNTKFIIFDEETSPADKSSQPLPRSKKDRSSDSALTDEDYHVNIWDEGPDSDSNIVFEKETDADGYRPVLAASFNKLVERMTDGKNVDVKFVKTFVLTYQSFTTPEKLLEKLTERFNGIRQEGAKLLEFYSQQRNIQIRVYNAMKMWLELSPELEGNDALCETFFKFIRETLLIEHPKLAKQLRTYCIRAKQGKLNRNRGMTIDVTPPPSLIPKGSKSNLWEYDPEEIARQMTLIDFKKFQAIKPNELLGQAWNKEKDHYKAPNVMALIKRINFVGNWVATNILTQSEVKGRAKRFSDFVQIATHLYSLNNFSTLMSILGGLNDASILRLKHTKKEVDKKILKKLEELEKVMTPEGNYRNFRETIHTVNPPCIPYLGVVTSDLTFLDDGNPNFVNGLINFGKRRLVFQIIADMMTYQDKPYNFLPIPEVSDQLIKIMTAGNTLMDSKTLYEFSLQREPRGS